MSTESQEYASAYGTARACLITLSRMSPETTAVTFRELLRALDDLDGDTKPSTYALVGARSDVLVWFESAVRRMIDGGGDPDALELLLKVARAV